MGQLYEVPLISSVSAITTEGMNFGGAYIGKTTNDVILFGLDKRNFTDGIHYYVTAGAPLGTTPDLHLYFASWSQYNPGFSVVNPYTNVLMTGDYGSVTGTDLDFFNSIGELRTALNNASYSDILYPITYHYENSIVSGPSEAAVGDTVIVSAMPNVGYGITDASTQILVTNDDVAVPYTWDAANQRITFTMPQPTENRGGFGSTG